MPSPPASDVDELIDEFSIDVDATEPLFASPGGTRAFFMRRPDLCENLYIIDTPAARRVACHPHVVGEEFDELNMETAVEAARVMKSVLGKVEPGESVFLHVLRAAPGYRLHEALRALNQGFREVWVRPKYVEPSYRAHDGTVERRIEVIFRDFSALPRGRSLTVFKPDTEATGRSGIAALREFARACEEAGSTVERIVLYGFISAPGLRALAEEAKGLGAELWAFAICDVCDLAANGYDMPLYGPDESLYSATGRVAKLGSIVDRSTLEDMLPEFPPGSDQPGDWSARQTRLFTGTGYEPGNIEEHLANSLSLLKRLRELSRKQPWFKPWHDKIFKREIEALATALSARAA